MKKHAAGRAVNRFHIAKKNFLAKKNVTFLDNLILHHLLKCDVRDVRVPTERTNGRPDEQIFFLDNFLRIRWSQNVFSTQKVGLQDDLNYRLLFFFSDEKRRYEIKI